MPSGEILAAGAAVLASLVYAVGFVAFKPRDWKFALNGARVVATIKMAARRGETTAEFWYKHLKERPLDKPAMVFEGRTYTFGDLEEGSNRVANWALARGLARGDCVALYMGNCPEYVMVWLGLCKIGVTTALINHNLKREPLVHSVSVSGASALVFGADLSASVAEVRGDLRRDGEGDVDAFVFSRTDADREAAARDAPFAEPLDAALLDFSASPVPEEATAAARGVGFADPFLFVYTSGTTGMPKAAKITQFRFLAISNGMSTFMGIHGGDRVYCPLPLYHSAAGLLGVGVMFRTGCTMVLRRKFSASHFWEDVRAHRVTVVQYIGELCRYLVMQPRHELDAENSVRLAVGNGLRPDVWNEFQSRFGIDRIGEFYGATEGAGVLVNTENKPGAVGFISPLLRVVAESVIVKYDREAGDVVRDEQGRCVRCAPGEEGEFLVRIREFARGVSNFSGYSNPKATQRKVLRDVFSQGDSFFRSGDILRADKDGFVFFVDRIGDTFRWKGENVATSEVALAISSFSPATAEPNVYGVALRGIDGRAGMVAFDAAAFDPAAFDWAGFAAHLEKSLPAYARPVFVRALRGGMTTTGTFKHKKTALREEGADPLATGDVIYFFDGSAFRPLDVKTYEDICEGRVRI